MFRNILQRADDPLHFAVHALLHDLALQRHPAVTLIRALHFCFAGENRQDGPARLANTLREMRQTVGRKGLRPQAAGKHRIGARNIQQQQQRVIDLQLVCCQIPFPDADARGFGRQNKVTVQPLFGFNDVGIAADIGMGTDHAALGRPVVLDIQGAIGDPSNFVMIWPAVVGQQGGRHALFGFVMQRRIADVDHHA